MCFFDSIRQVFPAKYSRLKHIFAGREEWRAYKNDQKVLLEKLRKKYRMLCYTRQPEKTREMQLSF
jgi:hypothetical protein